MSNGRKIQSENENPIDNVLIDFSNNISPQIRELGFNPNMLTTIGTIFGILSVYSVYIDKYIQGFIFFWISYYFDCLDGFYARKYKLYSKFGDYYDHIRDVIVAIFLNSVILYKLKSGRERAVFVVVFFTFLLLSLVHMGCQEKKSTDTCNNDSLQLLTKLCIDKSHIEYTRYVGIGTLNLVISLFILYLNTK
jgi:phosphatidylglycerophosphate synthase